MAYKSVVATARGASDVLKVVDNQTRPPQPGEARVRILAVAVCQDDIAVRVGNRPVLPKVPFVPGYSFIGVVDAVGEGVTRVAPGDRVAALTNLGAYAETIYWKAAELVRVPETVDPIAAAPLILDYLVAYQTLHRVAKVKAGDKVLIVGASGGVGTAYLQLGQLADLKMYGLASYQKHAVLAAYGATPIDYRSEDFVARLQAEEPGGLDAVFNGMAGDYLGRGLQVLKRGGTLVHYGAPESFAALWVLVGKLLLANTLPNGKTVKGYGTHRLGFEAMEGDWLKLFALLEAGKIDPIVAATFPILEARAANEMFERHEFVGNIVLAAPELTRAPVARSG